jgi:hypothetical protein
VEECFGCKDHDYYTSLIINTWPFDYDLNRQHFITWLLNTIINVMFMYYCQSDEVIFQLTESRPVIKVFHSRFLTRYKWLCYFLLYKMYYNTLCHVYYMDESITRESKSVTQDLLTPRINQFFYKTLSRTSHLLEPTEPTNSLRTFNSDPCQI